VRILRDGRQHQSHPVMPGQSSHLQQQPLGNVVAVISVIFDLIIEHFAEVDEGRSAHQRLCRVDGGSKIIAAGAVAGEPHIALAEELQPIPLGNGLLAGAQEGIASIMQTGLRLEHHAGTGAAWSYGCEEGRCWRAHSRSI
jgi:hypothetical protein